MSERRDRRVVVVTGGGSGIGQACCKQIEARGMRPVCWDVTSAADVVCDVSDEGSVREALEQTVQSVGSPVGLVAAAGISGTANEIVNADADQWDRVMSVNAKGTFLAVKHLAAEMIRSSNPGSIVAISSSASYRSDPTLSAYAASKAAVNQIVRAAAVELGRHRIMVNAVAPGPTRTPMTASRFAGSAARTVAEQSPLRRIGEPDDIAGVVTALLDSSWVTGQILTADDGAALVSPLGAAWLAAQVPSGPQDGEVHPG